MLAVSMVYSVGQPITVLWDSGSDVTLITHSMSKGLGLSGIDVMMSLVKVGNTVEKYMSKEYSLCVQDKSGVCHDLKVVGMDAVSSWAAVPNLFCTTDRFNVSQYFHGPAFKVWRINTTK